MAYYPNSRQDYSGYMTPFYMEPAKKDVMGYRLVDSFLKAGDVVLPGTPIMTDPNGTDVANGTKTAAICKYAVVVAVANDKKTLTVERGHWFQAGDKCAISGANSLTELTISTADKTTIKLSATNNSIKAGDILVETETGEGSGATTEAKHLPNRIVDTVAKIDDLDHTVSACHEVVVLENVVKYPEEYLNRTSFPGSTLLVGDPKILFVVQ
jgi:hypothetical protein